MIIKKASDIKSSEITSETLYRQRREFLKAAGLTAVGLGSASLSLQANAGARRDREKLRKELTKFKHITTYNNYYEFGTRKSSPARLAKTLKTEPWSISVDGECEKPGKIDFEDIVKKMHMRQRIYRLRCVEGWSMVIPWEGFELGELLKRFKPTSKAKYVYFETLLDPDNMPGQKLPLLDWPYREGLRMDEAMNSLTIMATGLYGKDLLNQNGAPIRLVVPWKYGFKSIKSIAKIRFVKKQPETSWQKAGKNEYGFYSNVNPKVAHKRWSQKRERRIGEFRKRKTLMFNGYAEEVASLYKGMDLKKYF